MFGPITIPFGAKMLFNTLRLKPGASMDDVELALGEMCDAVRTSCGGDKGGFIAGQAFRFSGFVSNAGSIRAPERTEAHVAIVTYWRSFEEHERSHAIAEFRHKFAAVAELCSESTELGYDLLWQGDYARGA
jgi:hypothetical protein